MIDQETKDLIDRMSQEDMCRLWRFAIPGSRFFVGEVGDYFKTSLREKGGMTPEISKKLGW